MISRINGVIVFCVISICVARAELTGSANGAESKAVRIFDSYVNSKCGFSEAAFANWEYRGDAALDAANELIAFVDLQRTIYVIRRMPEGIAPISGLSYSNGYVLSFGYSYRIDKKQLYVKKLKLVRSDKSISEFAIAGILDGDEGEDIIHLQIMKGIDGMIGVTWKPKHEKRP
jgi:hypothetical protein